MSSTYCKNWKQPKKSLYDVSRWTTHSLPTNCLSTAQEKASGSATARHTNISRTELLSEQSEPHETNQQLFLATDSLDQINQFSRLFLGLLMLRPKKHSQTQSYLNSCSQKHRCTLCISKTTLLHKHLSQNKRHTKPCTAENLTYLT